MKRLLLFFSFLILTFFSAMAGTFVTIDGTQFSRNGRPYYYIGANLWYAPWLAADGVGDGRTRLVRELDLLQQAGVSNLRVPVKLAQDSLPVLPADSLLAGLDFLLQEMGKREMTAVLCLSDSAQDEAAFRHLATVLLQRRNTFTDVPYANDPVIMAWELGEDVVPRADETTADFVKRLSEMAAFVKQLDARHLVAVGTSGLVSFRNEELVYETLQNNLNIDYLTVQLWPDRWNWVTRGRVFEDLPNVYLQTSEFLSREERFARRAGKPVVIESLSYPRDKYFLAPSSSVNCRTSFFRSVFDRIVRSSREADIWAGAVFCGWGGYGRFTGSHWQPGNDYLYERPGEVQGTHSVYATDSLTLQLLKTSAAALQP